MKKIAIIGASYLQNPLILKAKEMGIETHVFAWAAGDIGEKTADYFYPISITEKEDILSKCRQIGIDGICTIASDLAVVTVNYVANAMGLIGNSLDATEKSTNKNLMRKCFSENGDPSPLSVLVDSAEDLRGYDLKYPVIVKPLDRSGSRGITKLEEPKNLDNAIESAKECGFIKKALVEEFAEGDEYSVEAISYKGNHKVLAVTKKYTTGAPHFIETGHMEPAELEPDITEKIRNVVNHALDSLGILFGASHSEIKINDKGDIYIIEIGGRMGGDLIGSHLVRLSTGIDFLKAVISVAMGEEPDLSENEHYKYAAVRFVMNNDDVERLERIKTEIPWILEQYELHGNDDETVTDSSNRHGYYLIRSDDYNELKKNF